MRPLIAAIVVVPLASAACRPCAGQPVGGPDHQLAEAQRQHDDGRDARDQVGRADQRGGAAAGALPAQQPRVASNRPARSAGRTAGGRVRQ